MYRNLKAELARKGWDVKVLAAETGISYTTLLNKMQGKSEFKFDECIVVKAALNTSLPLEHLFMH